MALDHVPPQRLEIQPQWAQQGQRGAGKTLMQPPRRQADELGMDISMTLEGDPERVLDTRVTHGSGAGRTVADEAH